MGTVGKLLVRSASAARRDLDTLGRRLRAGIAIGCVAVAWWLLLGAARVGTPEAYTLPPSLAALALGANSVTFESDDRASVLTSVYAWHRTPRDATPRIWGCYHDVAVRTSGGWRLAERQLRVAGQEQWSAEFHPLAGPRS